MLDYGSGGGFTVTMDGPFGGGGGGTTAKLTKIAAPASSWKGAASPYYQIVNVSGININNKVDIHLSGDQIEQLSDQNITFTVQNASGTATLYAIGDKPAVDCTFQVTLTEVLNISGESMVICGNSVSTNKPRANYGQSNENMADFILNKPELLDMDTFSVTLYANNWQNKTQRVESNKIQEDSNKQAIISVSDPNNLEMYLDCNIKMAEQQAGSITFECDEVPTSDIIVNLLILTKGG